MIHWRLNSAEFSDLKIWTTSKNQQAVSHSSGEMFLAYLQSINKQKYTRCAFGIPEMPVLNLLNGREPQFAWAEEYLCGARTQKHSESCGKQAFTLQVSA